MRPADLAEDGEALYEVFRASMGHIIERLMGWKEEDFRAFHGRWVADDARDVDVIELDGEVVGLLDVERAAEEIHLARIELHPHVQGRGIGTELIEMLQDEARDRDVPISLDVFKINRAVGLYERLGFRIAAERDENRWRMVWEPA